MSSKVDQVAQALNITPRRIQQLVREGMPKGARGEYNLAACLMWYIRYLQAAIAAPEGAEPSVRGLIAVRTQMLRLDNERREMQNLKARGEVLLASEVKQQVAKAIGFSRKAFAGLARRVASDDPDLQARVTAEVAAIEGRFAENLASLTARPKSRARR